MCVSVGFKFTSDMQHELPAGKKVAPVGRTLQVSGAEVS